MSKEGPTGPRGDARPTTRLDSHALTVSWPIALASLEQLASWGTFAQRLGMLALVQECVRELAQRDASASFAHKLKELAEALVQMPYEK